MGVIRLSLALAVVLAHGSRSRLGPLTTLPPDMAVQAFYVISGFYMSLILSTKYRGGPRAIKLFFSNRLLRLAPTYLVVLAATLAGALIMRRNIYFKTTEFEAVWAQLAPGTKVVVALANLVVIGQDALMFTSIDPVTGHLQWDSNFQNAPLPTYKFLLVPQAWSLSVELWFYALAPFLVRLRSRYLLGIVGLSVAGRLMAYAAGLSHDPWTYRFF